VKTQDNRNVEEPFFAISFLKIVVSIIMYGQYVRQKYLKIHLISCFQLPRPLGRG